MLSGRGRGRGGSTGARAVLRSQGPQEPDKRTQGVKTVASQALGTGRASSRSPARGQATSGERGVTSSLIIIHCTEVSSDIHECLSFTGGRSQSTTPTTGTKGKLRTAPVPRSSSPKTAKKRSLGQKLTVKEDAENNDVTETDSVKADSEEKAAELTEAHGESKPVQKPVRKQKLPRLNDNPDAPEVVDVPNMRSSHVERLSDARTYENGGTSVNGDCDSDNKEDTAPGDKPEPLKDSKVTLDDRIMPPLIAGEDKCEAQPCQENRDKDKGAESGGGSPDKSIVLIPLSDESCDAKGAGAKVTKEQDNSAETKDQLNGQGDEMLTNMIRENLNRAVSISNDSSNASSVDEMKQSLLNAIKDTLESSNSKQKTEDSSDVELPDQDEKSKLNPENQEKVTKAREPLLFIKNGNKITSQPFRKQKSSKDAKEEVITNGEMVNGNHEETEHSAGDSSELGDRPGDVKTKDGEVSKTEKLENDLADLDHKTDLITNAEIEISPEPIEKNGTDSSLAASGDGINDLIIDIQSSSSLKEDSSKVPTIPTEASASITSLDQLEKGMLPVSSVQIEHVENMDVEGAIPDNLEVVDMPGISVVVTEEEEKPKLNIDKDKLFSQMNDIFAKDTHKALKNKPVYQKRGRPGKEDQAETQQPSPPAKKKKLKGIKKNKTNVERSKEEPPVEKNPPADEESESIDSEDLPPPVLERNEPRPPVLERNEPSKELNSEDESLSLFEEEETPPTTGDGAGNGGPENVPDKEITVEAESMDLLEKLEMLEEGFEEENLEVEVEEKRINNCDIDQEDATVESVHNDVEETKETLVTTTEAQKETASSPKDATEHSLSSELTKSLRKARPFKKSPSKILSKDKSWEEDPASEEEDQMMDGSASSPVKELSSSVPKTGPDVFDFTDEEDLPLSNIDMDVLDAASDKTSHKISAVEMEEPQPTLDHELSHLSPQSTKSSPNKLSRHRVLDVSPQILSVTDAVAAVAALQVGLDDIKEDIKEDIEDGDDVKMNGEAGSDGDTDNSTSNGRTSQFSEKAKVSVKRKKRRVAESDEGKI